MNPPTRLAAALLLLLAACARPPAPGSLAGSVQDGSGQPVPGATVSLYHAQPAAAAPSAQSVAAFQATTDAEGRFRYPRVEPGAYRLLAQKGEVTAQASAAVQPGRETPLEPLTLQLPGRVEGRVTLQGASDHSGAQVYIPGTQHAAYTDAQGAFALQNVPAGEYTVVAQAAGYARASGTARVASGKAAALDLALAKPETVGRVAGRVTLQGASDHSGVLVFIPGTPHSSLTAPDGSYALEGLAPGAYGLAAQHPGFARAGTTVEVAAGQTANAPEFTLARAETVGRVEGRVTLGGAGDLSDTRVFLSGTPHATLTGPDGSYALEGVAPGAYTLRAERGGHAPASAAVTVAAGQAARADLALSPLPAPPAPAITRAPLLTTRGGLLTLEGSGFGASRGLSQVSVGGALASEYLEWGDARVTVRVPRAAAPGPREVRVATPHGEASAGVWVVRVTPLAAGNIHSLAVRADGTVAGWGNDDYRQATPPAGLTGAVAVSAGSLHSLALKADGTVAGWGDNGFGRATPPAELTGAAVVAIAAGGAHSLALKADGTVAGWGDNGSNRATPPVGLTDVVAIAAGGAHSLALKADGTVVGWGDNTYGQASVPAELTGAAVVAIAAGSIHSLALKADGRVVGWGANSLGRAIPPDGLSGVVAIAAGGAHSLALKADGTVVGWGYDFYGQATVPAGLRGVVAIAAGVFHSLALKADGTVVGWGDNSLGRASPPPGLVGLVP